MRARVGILLVVVLSVTAAHYLTPTTQHSLHALYRWFYYLPIILGAFWFGLRGGVGVAIFITAIYLPHVFIQWSGGGAVHWLEVVLYNVVGGVTGVLAQQLRGERDRYRRAAEDLDRAYGELKKSTHQLLETEEQLHHADRLAALGELSAELAHEIRTPLASIRGAAEILAGPAQQDEREEFAAILMKEVDRLNRVLTEFLEFSRPRSEPDGHAEPRVAVADALSLLRLRADRCGVRLSERIEIHLPMVAVGEEPLKQVVINLVMNAIQASTRGDEVRVLGSTDGSSVTLIVEDEGPGIPAVDRVRVLEPFFTTRKTGTGLGLSIVRRIVEGHGGAIGVGSGGSRGTTVTVRLPIVERTDA